MDLDVKTIYLWEPVGSRTCSTCLSMPKWSDDPPDRPHDYCDCEISMYTGVAMVKYRNIQETSGGGTTRIERRSTSVYNPSDEPMPYTKTFSIQLKTSTEVKISAIADKVGLSSGGETTRTFTDSISVNIPPKKRLVLEMTIESVERIYTAEKYYVFPTFDFDDYTDDWEEMSGGEVEGVRVIDEWGNVDVEPDFED